MLLIETSTDCSYKKGSILPYFSVSGGFPVSRFIDPSLWFHLLCQAIVIFGRSVLKRYALSWTTLLFSTFYTTPMLPMLTNCVLHMTSMSSSISEESLNISSSTINDFFNQWLKSIYGVALFTKHKISAIYKYIM